MSARRRWRGGGRHHEPGGRSNRSGCRVAEETTIFGVDEEKSDIYSVALIGWVIAKAGGTSRKVLVRLDCIEKPELY